MHIRSAEGKAPLVADIVEDTLRVCANRQELGEIPCIVLTGGSMGEATLRALGSHASADVIEWDRVRFLWGDERWVPVGHADRNDRLADELLFAHRSVDEALVHRVAGSDSGLSLDDAAAAYAEIVDGIDRIDLVFLGVGPDGHVASLFPGRDDLLRDGSLGAEVASAIPVRDSPKPPSERVSLSLPTLRRADEVWLLAVGNEKAPAVSGIISAEQGLPAALVDGREQTILWTDRAALDA